ncbi:hypothetical protein MSAN_01384800 [Mycena sanguinolenta]|uniref:Uncharacterized protein n=1 Tax=Mycena sanguinolenta TaxID=230812 RepID=A0A8H6YAV3_9AGAR|nr:hypothetical protein MSAN_01384800 [Mycena sanguinolenta]
MANTTELPNPFTPLAFLEPAVANAFEVSRYLFAGTLGASASQLSLEHNSQSTAQAYIWDIALNLGNDCALLFRHRIGFPTVVYFLSRAFTLSYILTSFVFQVAAVKDCEALQHVLGVSVLLGQTATSMLFLLRAAAVWHSNKIALATFSLLWIGVIGANITVPVEVRGVHIGPTLHCINSALPQNLEVVGIMSLIYDTVIFFAISYRIISYTVDADSSRDLIRAFFGRGQLSKLSLTLIQSGQQFYLVAMCTNIIVLVLLWLPVSEIYKGMITIPAIAIINAMACLVFRKTKFGIVSADGTTRATSIDFGVTENQRSMTQEYRTTELPGTTNSVGENSLPQGVPISAELGHGIVAHPEPLKIQILV